MNTELNNKTVINSNSKNNLQKEISEILNQFESGERKAVHKDHKSAKNSWFVDKKAMLELNKLFKLEKSMFEIQNVIKWSDKIPFLTETMNNETLLNKTYRLVAGCWIRRGVNISDDVVVMSNSFINIGAQIGQKTMIDSGVTVGSCAYIGSKCHISSNTVIAGVLEPSNSNPVIIDDNVFVGAQCLISEGAKVPYGCIIASGVKITNSTKLLNREGEILDKIPELSLIVPGFYKSGQVYISCNIVAKTFDSVQDKSKINDILRNE
ncbi:DapH/DapD/GlmU-related protein [Candidatus Nesciobacter abundans]|uniref:2,3,4,5-tetrahydropyridine-2,6-dicarboxylate N-succinyltransferase n=1 Tax=Candidatus Nesciobacter abundans TaxID=2601668 RepID=A0A5C0UGB1_9PROT|nr:DapH/DapD/GlmU-related protein [Candidatus Nesciobacter abundans]QEK38849.1 hypothetical protein FZC36_00100 [Candidatus Nesciobacter abundans]